ncbi:MAG TPA: deoxyribodipyrimidine photo-lyase [Nevskiaceae bacterium]|nr:deoxyribodipyrimidine photo-lyase [Nevskiaceae bacterium]
MKTAPPTVLCWFRRDLRLTDNPALCAALEEAQATGARLLPVFVWAPEEEAPWAPGAASRWWLHHSLAALSAELAARGAPLLIRRGPTLATLQALAAETGAVALFWNRLYEPALICRDGEVKAALREAGLKVESHNGTLLAEPWTVKTGGGGPYRVFSPFWRSVSASLPAPEVLPAPATLPGLANAPDGLPLAALALLPRIAWDGGFYRAWSPGEQGALQRLDQWMGQGAGHYHEGRNWPAADHTSRLSPHLHFGEISPRQLRLRLQRELDGGRAGFAPEAEHYVRELGWREFAHHLLFHYPHTPDRPLYERFEAFPWRPAAEAAEDLAAWQRGATGVPIVDAGMRQLWGSGWMHNRVRMIVASFLTKNLLIPWQEGARWFWDTLVDASLANNTLGWQWAAGCGADAAPYFRVFNPVLQSQKFDGEARYLQHWVPELAQLAPAACHAPWTAKAGQREAAGLRLGEHYPLPRVDLAASRDRALAAYGALRGGADG